MKAALFVALLFLLSPFPAWANLDYRCLNTCMKEGEKPTTCQRQCEYDKKEIKPHAPTQGVAITNHKVFDAPKPIDGILTKPKKKVKSKPSMDYACLNQCLKDGMQYQLCATQCRKDDCPPGKLSCDTDDEPARYNGK